MWKGDMKDAIYKQKSLINNQYRIEYFIWTRFMLILPIDVIRIILGFYKIYIKPYEKYCCTSGN